MSSNKDQGETEPETPSNTPSKTLAKNNEELRKICSTIGSFFNVSQRLKLDEVNTDQISLHAKYTTEEQCYYALVLKP